MTAEAHTSAKTTAPSPQGDPPSGPQSGAVRRAWATVRHHPIASAVAIALLLGLAAWAGLSGVDGSNRGYITATVQRGDIEDTVTAVGNLQPRDYVDVGAQVSGQLKKIYVNIGDRVKEGQLLAEIDAQVQTAKVAVDKANVANLKAQLADRRAQFALTEANFLRQKRLMAADATSRSDYDGADQALKSARAQTSALSAQVAAAESQLNGDTVTLGYTRIYAPMTGTIVSVAAKQGQTLNANQQAPVILRIGDLSTMTVWTQVSEADVPKLRLGMPAYFMTLGNPNKRWVGKLTQVQPTPDVVNNVVLYTATFDVKNPHDELMTQMTAQVFFVVASVHDVLTVPVAALRQRRARGNEAEGSSDLGTSGQNASQPTQGAHRRRTADEAQGTADRLGQRRSRLAARKGTVRVVERDGSIQNRTVLIGVSNRVTAQIISGLSAGEKVIVGTEQTAKDPADNARRTDLHSPQFGPRI